MITSVLLVVAFRLKPRNGGVVIACLRVDVDGVHCHVSLLVSGAGHGINHSGTNIGINEPIDILSSGDVSNPIQADL